MGMETEKESVGSKRPSLARHRTWGMGLVHSTDVLSNRAWIGPRRPLGLDKRSLRTTYITLLQRSLPLAFSLTANSASQATLTQEGFIK